MQQYYFYPSDYLSFYHEPLLFCSYLRLPFPYSTLNVCLSFLLPLKTHSLKIYSHEEQNKNHEMAFSLIAPRPSAFSGSNEDLQSQVLPNTDHHALLSDSNSLNQLHCLLPCEKITQCLVAEECILKVELKLIVQQVNLQFNTNNHPFLQSIKLIGYPHEFWISYCFLLAWLVE